MGGAVGILRGMKWIGHAAAGVILLCGWGCTTPAPTITLRVHEQVNPQMPASRVRFVMLDQGGDQIAISPFPTINEKDIVSADMDQTDGVNTLILRLDVHGANALMEMTTRMRDQSVVVLINEQPIAKVYIERPSPNGEFRIGGDFSEAQIVQWVQAINQVAARRRDFGDVAHTP
jgi:hypothetical protein